MFPAISTKKVMDLPFYGDEESPGIKSRPSLKQKPSEPGVDQLTKVLSGEAKRESSEIELVTPVIIMEPPQEEAEDESMLVHQGPYGQLKHHQKKA